MRGGRAKYLTCFLCLGEHNCTWASEEITWYFTSWSQADLH